MNRLPMRTALLAALFLLASRASYAAPERFTTIRVNIQEEKIELFLRFGTDRRSRSGEYRLYSRKVNPKTGRRRNLGTFSSRAAAEKHERAVQFFKRRG